MNRKVVSGIIFPLLLMGVLASIFNVQPVKASGTIYIRADGSIDPPTAPISSLDNVTYTFTDNIASDGGAIVVKRDNIVIDGAGYTVQGTGIGIGIDLSERRNVTVKNVEIKAFIYGIRLYDSPNNIIQGNNIIDNRDGIRLFDYSNNNSVSGNHVVHNTIGIWIFESSYNSVYRNDITANNQYGIRVCYCAPNNKIYHNNFVDNSDHVYSWKSTNVWDDGYPSGGNYWSNYNGTDLFSGSYQNETGYDWIGDSPYIIDENSQDNYPLMDLFVSKQEKIKIAYRNLLFRHSELLSNFETLNSTCHELFGNITSIQEKYDSLLTTIEDMQEHIILLNSTLQTSIDELQELYNSLNSTLISKQEAILNELGIVRNLTYVFIATTILVATTFYFAVRKPKTKS